MNNCSKDIVIIENTYYTVLSLRKEIILYLQKQGYSIHILSCGDKEDELKLLQINCKVYDLGVLVSHPVSLLRYLYRMVRFLKEIKPQMVFSFTIRPNIFGSIVCRYLKIAIVSNVTGSGPLFESRSILYFLVRKLYKFAFKKNKTVFFQNEDDYNSFLNSGFVSKSQSKLLPGSGVDTAYYSPQPKGKSTSPFSFLMISRLIFDKGILEFVQASELLKKEYPEVQCQILGPFWTQNVKKNTITNEQMNQWETNGWVNYLGYTYDVRPYIAEADVLVLPSYREGCANVLMQGASMSKPLIATDVTGCNNLIENNKTGYLCEVKNVSSLVVAMKKMLSLSRKELEEMGQKGREKMKQEYEKQLVLSAYKAELD